MKKEIPPQGFSPAGFFPHKIKWEKTPAGFFIQKSSYHILAQISIIHSAFKVVSGFFQNREISISPSGGRGPKIYVTKMAIYPC